MQKHYSATPSLKSQAAYVRNILTNFNTIKHWKYFLKKYYNIIQRNFDAKVKFLKIINKKIICIVYVKIYLYFVFLYMKICYYNNFNNSYYEIHLYYI